MPLFILGGVKIGRRFFCGSLLGMVLSSILIDAFAKITMPPMDSLLCALYGLSLIHICMGFGGIPIQRIDAEGTKALMHKLLENGVNYIDTARGYTVSEEYLGIGLEGCLLYTSIKERVPYVLELVGLESKMNRHPNEMSGGEQQRLAIARALVNNPSTIIADEPTGNLDPERSFEIMALLQEINNLGTTMLVVTHDQNLAKLFHKRTIAINEGVVVRDGIGEESKHEAQ